MPLAWWDKEINYCEYCGTPVTISSDGYYIVCPNRYKLFGFITRYEHTLERAAEPRPVVNRYDVTTGKRLV